VVDYIYYIDFFKRGIYLFLPIKYVVKEMFVLYVIYSIQYYSLYTSSLALHLLILDGKLPAESRKQKLLAMNAISSMDVTLRPNG